jgi:hypothetical protein
MALAMRAEPGAELACRAQSYRFPHAGGLRERGVISYYATRSLPPATTLAAWLQRVQADVRADLQSGRLPRVYRPVLQVLGEPAARLPGEPVVDASGRVD